MIFPKILEACFPLLIGFTPVFIIVLFIVYRKKQKSLSRKSPINTYLLRAPGQTLMEKIDDYFIEIYTLLLSIPAVILVIYSVYQTSSKSNFVLTIAVGLSISFLIVVFLKIKRLIDEHEKLKLGHEAELAIGQELNQLMRYGFYVFHDVSLNNTISEFNIDHIVVGSTGVFAIETKGRSKPKRSNGEFAFRMSFDGQRLIFPDHEETSPVLQAKRQAESLQKWLCKALAEPVKVKAVIALPGWYVTTTQKTDIALINGKNPERYFNSVRESLLTQKQIEQIAFQLDTICRNVEPRAYAAPK